MKDVTKTGQEAAIRALCKRWANAISDTNVPELGRLMVEDVVVVHGDGRCLLGRDAVMADLSVALKKIRVNQRVEPQETIVAGEWAIDRSRVHTNILSLDSGEQRDIYSHTLTILRKELLNGWLVARVIGVVEQPERWNRNST